MKILHIYKTYYPESIGGIEKLIHSLAIGLKKIAVYSDVAVCTLNKTRQVGLDDSQVYFFNQQLELASCPISLPFMRNFRKLVQGYDILHYHFPWPFADLLHLILPSNRPAVLTYHSDIVRQTMIKPLYLPLMNLFFKRLKRIIATSDKLATTSSELRNYSHKTSIIPIGIDRCQYPQVSDALLAEWKARLGDDFFLFVGVLRYYKGLDFLLEAVVNSNIRLVIAGTGPEERRLHHYAKLHHIDNVIFLGKVSEEVKVALLKLCRCVIAPAHLRSEAFCISLLEGLMFGKPLISTELGTGTSFVNEHQVSGLVVAPGNPQQLHEAMQALMTNHDLYNKLQVGALAHYEKNFTAKQMCQEYKKIYQEVLINE